MVTQLFSKSVYQTASERRPLVLIGHGFYDDIKLVKKNHGINMHNTDVDMIEACYIVLGAGIVRPADLKGFEAAYSMVSVQRSHGICTMQASMPL